MLLPISTKNRFSDYLEWMSTHPYGMDEMNAKNNHGTCWMMQAAVFARYVGDLSCFSALYRPVTKSGFLHGQHWNISP